MRASLWPSLHGPTSPKNILTIFIPEILGSHHHIKALFDSRAQLKTLASSLWVVVPTMELYYLIFELILTE
jgi:hypothetical protein